MKSCDRFDCKYNVSGWCSLEPNLNMRLYLPSDAACRKPRDGWNTLKGMMKETEIKDQMKEQLNHYVGEPADSEFVNVCINVMAQQIVELMDQIDNFKEE
jgi:hypothetical protein